jgi:hypothetical protein
MKNKYAILRDDGCFYRETHGVSKNYFFWDTATFFEKECYAKAHWEMLPYNQAIKCKIVELGIVESVNKIQTVDKAEERGY